MLKRKPGKKAIFFTLPKTNIALAPEIGWLEDFLVSFWDGLLSGAKMLVSGSVVPNCSLPFKSVDVLSEVVTMHSWESWF